MLTPEQQELLVETRTDVKYLKDNFGKWDERLRQVEKDAAVAKGGVGVIGFIVTVLASWGWIK